MRLLAASDLHGNRDLYRALPALAHQHDVAAVVLAGDLLGSPEGFATEEEAQRADAAVLVEALSVCAVPVFYIMGNDDWIGLGLDTASVRPVHLARAELHPYNVVGYQCTLPFMGGIFERREEEIASDLAGIEQLIDDRTILVTHSPARGVLDTTQLGSAGSASIAALIETRKPRLHIHGHIHGSFGRSGIHFNVAAGRQMRAMLIDVERLEHEVIVVPVDPPRRS